MVNISDLVHLIDDRIRYALLKFRAGSSDAAPSLPLSHKILSVTHSDTTPSAPNDQDVLTWNAATSKWIAKAGGGAGSPHALLSATHTDTVPEAVARGDIIAGNSTPKWDAVQAKTLGFMVQGTGVDVVSAPFNWDTIAGGAGAYMVHDHSASMYGGPISGGVSGSGTNGQITKWTGAASIGNATNTDSQVSAAVTASHAKQHALDATADHSIGSLTNTYLVKNDGSKLVDATNTDSQVSGAVSASHARQHAITSASDHTSAATSGQILKADANGLPVNATNTDTDVADAVTKKHARQHAITSTSDHTSSATSGKMLKADANGLATEATNTDTDVASAVSLKHAQAHNVFSSDHADTTGAASVVDGDLIIGNATPKWSKLAISIPGGAGLLNVLGIINGELRASWKALFDATNPTTIGVGDSAAPGTATVAAHRDHQHASPSTFPPSSHAHSAHTGIGSDDHHNHVTLGAGNFAALSISTQELTLAQGTGASQVPAGNDARFSDKRNPVDAILNVALNGTYNDYDPGADYQVLIVTPGNTWATFTGFARGSATNNRLLIINIDTSYGIIINHQNAGSAAGNRVITVTGGDISIAGGTYGSALLEYDATASRWREIALAPRAHHLTHNQTGDVIANANTTYPGLLLTAVAPAAGLLNVPGIANGETVYTMKPMFDSVNPAADGVAAPGTQVIAARRDHVHPAGASGGSSWLMVQVFS